MQTLSPRFISQQFFKIGGDILTQIYRDLYGRRHAGAHPDGHQHGGRKPTETFVSVVCYESLNLSLEELKNIKIFFF